MHEFLIRKLELYVPLSDEERAALESLLGVPKTVNAGEDIVIEGDRPTNSTLIERGFVCRYRALPNGRRQILSFHMAGDMIDLHSYLLKEMDHSIGALADCTLTLFPHPVVDKLLKDHPRIALGLWRDTMVEGAVFREWLVGMGRRSAYGRIAHLLCEVLVRMRAIGLTQGFAYRLPLTQAELADSLGLSLVHVNRVLQKLRAEKLISFRTGQVEIHDWPRLKAAAEFDPSYLHLDGLLDQTL